MQERDYERKAHGHNYQKATEEESIINDEQFSQIHMCRIQTFLLVSLFLVTR